VSCVQKLVVTGRVYIWCLIYYEDIAYGYGQRVHMLFHLQYVPRVRGKTGTGRADILEFNIWQFTGQEYLESLISCKGDLYGNKRLRHVWTDVGSLISYNDIAYRNWWLRAGYTYGV
jgi:hypothetical protein